MAGCSVNHFSPSDVGGAEVDAVPRRRLHEQADVIASLAAEIRERDARIAALMGSRSWRLTAPIRMTIELARSSFVRRTIGGARRKAREWFAGRFSTKAMPDQDLSGYRTLATAPAGELIQQRILIVAELGLPQCAKYRVWQKQSFCDALGIPCTVIEWWRHDEVIGALPTHSMAIFYRVPAYDSTLANITEARRLGVPTFWEVDDLIFDPAAYAANANVQALDPALRKTVLDGVPLFRGGLLACDHGIASTESLAAAMREAGQASVFVIENGIDAATLLAADAARAGRRPAEQRAPAIVYGTGSKAHAADFALAADAIADVLRMRPLARFRLIGDLDLPPTFDDLLDRVDRLPFVDYAAYLRLLADADVTVAPVTPGAFNNAKSNIKWIEASLLGLPTVCSPRDEFRRVVQNGVNGFLATTRDDWRDALLALIDDEKLRGTIAASARRTAQDRYGPVTTAARGIGALAARFRPPPTPGSRVLIVNTFFAPQSFGGATVIAEQMAQRLDARPDMRAAVFTSWGDARAQPHAMTRFEVAGVPVFAVRMPDDVTPTLAYQNLRVAEAFGTVLDAWRPDVVHLHSVQGLGANIVSACAERGIPYVVTLHDAWWMCERQFMVRPEGRYCFQTRIDFGVCATCVADLGFSIRRSDVLRRALDGAALLLTPSDFHRQLHLANGISPERIVVNKNGVRVPAEPLRAASEGRLRFGFVGGIGPLKGLDLIRNAFEGAASAAWELRLVDNTLNLGFASINVDDWAVKGQLRVVSAYTQATMDDFFAGLDVLLFPSQWKESFGLTVREALARDVWVVVTDAGGAAEDVVDGVNGTVIPMGPDPAPLRAAIERLIVCASTSAPYVNPLRANLTTVDEQAEQLAALLAGVVAARAPDRSTVLHEAAD